MKKNEGIRVYVLSELNKEIAEAIQSYYKTHSADDFFHIDGLLTVCRKNQLTKEEIPQLIEMQNIIVLG